MDSDDPLISRSFDGWWERGRTLVRRSWLRLLLLQVPLVLASVVLQIMPTYLSYKSSLADDPERAEGLLGPLGQTALSMGTGAVVLIESMLATLAGTYLVLALAAEGPSAPGASVRAAYRAALRRIAPVVGWSLVVGLLVSAGFLACVVPGVYLAMVFTLMPAVVVFERGRTFRRCFALFHGDVSAALPRLMIITAIAYGMTVPATVLVGGAGIGLDEVGWTSSTAIWTVTVWTVLLGAAIQVGVSLLTVPLSVVTYADLRARREPLSTSQMVTEAAA
jgi:hypothetical protein